MALSVEGCSEIFSDFPYFEDLAPNMSLIDEYPWQADSSSFGQASTYFSHVNLLPHTAEVMPTPPRSPPLEADEIFSQDFTFDQVEMVNPNMILNQYQPNLDAFNSSSSDISLSSPALSPAEDPLAFDLSPILSDDVKMEILDPYFEDTFGLDSREFPLHMRCPHDVVGTVCQLCLDDTFKNEIVNDIMWTSGISTPLEDDKRNVWKQLGGPVTTSVVGPVSTSTNLSQTFTRPHLDSVSSRCSDVLDPLAGVMANIDSEFTESSAPRLETPSESSDTDTDVEENYTVGNVHLEHNYHFTHYKSERNDTHEKKMEKRFEKKVDIASPLMKALHKVSMAQTDSDDEIDVVNLGSHDNFGLSKYSKYHGTVAFRDAKECALVPTVTVGAPEKRGRKPGSVGSRKVGRPCKIPKRLNTKPAKPVTRRVGGGRALAMDPQKRSLHNSMERMRRVDLKNCFDAVRCNIPALRDRARAPKVLILKSAADLVKSLEKGEVKKRLEVEQLKQYQRLLLLKLQRLKGGAVMEEELG